MKDYYYNSFKIFRL